jgi:hypothetical protein
MSRYININEEYYGSERVPKNKKRFSKVRNYGKHTQRGSTQPTPGFSMAVNFGGQQLLGMALGFEDAEQVLSNCGGLVLS